MKIKEIKYPFFKLVDLLLNNPEEMKKFFGFDSDMIKVKNLFINIYFLQNIELINAIFKHSNVVFERYVFPLEGLNRRLEKGLLLNNDKELWTTDRNVMKDYFHNKKMKYYSKEIIKTIDESLDNLEKNNDKNKQKNGIPMLKSFTEIVIQLLINTIFSGSNLKSDGHYEMVKNYIHLSMPNNYFTKIKPLNLFFIPGKSYINFLKYEKFITNFAKEIVFNSISFASKDDNFIKALAEHYKIFNQEQFSKNKKQLDHFINHVLTFYIAGHETTTALICHLFVLLYKNPSYVRKLKNEIASIIGDKIPDYDDLERFSLTKACIQEALRIRPPACLLFARKLGEDFSYENVSFKKNEIVTVPIYMLHHHPDIWENPELFYPERFLGDKQSFIKDYFIPFGLGARACTGQQLAYLEAMLFFIRFFQKYDFEIDENYPYEPEQNALAYSINHQARMKIISLHDRKDNAF